MSGAFAKPAPRHLASAKAASCLRSTCRSISRAQARQCWPAARCLTAYGAADAEQQPLLRYGGYCATCAGAHCLSSNEDALNAARALIAQLDAKGRLDFDDSIPDERFGTAQLFEPGGGRMFGVLVAEPRGDDGGGERGTLLLSAFSGQIAETWEVPGWAGPVAGLTSTHGLYDALRRETDALSARLERAQTVLAAPPTSPTPSSRRFFEAQRDLLRRRRRGISHHLLQQVQRSYVTSDAAGRPLSLLDAYLACVDARAAAEEGEAALGLHGEAEADTTVSAQPSPLLLLPKLSVTRLSSSSAGGGGFAGFPTGTGDCAAAKLLHAAAAARLRPLALVEFWYGAPTATRDHGRAYAQCDKCAAILGAMLCGG